MKIGLSGSVRQFKMTFLSDILPIASQEQRYMLCIVSFEAGARSPVKSDVKMSDIITCSLY